MRQTTTLEDNARWYEDRDKQNPNVLAHAGGPAIVVADLKKEMKKKSIVPGTTTTNASTSCADIE